MGLKRIVLQTRILNTPFQYMQALVESFTGPRHSLLRHKQTTSSPVSCKTAIETINKRWPAVVSSATESPVFILSAGWRSGSTLLQRLLMSQESLLMWGEPYSHANLIDHLSRPTIAVTDQWPNEEWFIGNYKTEDLCTLWVANLYPQVQALLDAGVSFMRTLFAQPALDIGISRWGIKDVRLTIDHAIYLKWLFPNAKFIFLYRNPYLAYTSYRPARNWYKSWPKQPVFTPKKFANHWKCLLKGFIEGYKDIDGLLIKYEDLCDGTFDMQALEKFLSIEIDQSILKKKIGSSNVKKNNIQKIELLQVKRYAEPLASKLGYNMYS